MPELGSVLGRKSSEKAGHPSKWRRVASVASRGGSHPQLRRRLMPKNLFDRADASTRHTGDTGQIIDAESVGCGSAL